MVRVEICIIKGGSYPLVNLRIAQVLDLLTSVLVEQGNRGMVIYSPLEVVDTHVTTEGTLSDVVIGEQRRTCKTDTVGIGEQMHHVLSEDSILRAMGFIAHDDDLVVRVQRRGIRIVELLDK